MTAVDGARAVAHLPQAFSQFALIEAAARIIFAERTEEFA